MSIWLDSVAGGWFSCYVTVISSRSRSRQPRDRSSNRRRTSRCHRCACLYWGKERKNMNANLSINRSILSYASHRSFPRRFRSYLRNDPTSAWEVLVRSYLAPSTEDPRCWLPRTVVAVIVAVVATAAANVATIDVTTACTRYSGTVADVATAVAATAVAAAITVATTITNVRSLNHTLTACFFRLSIFRIIFLITRRGVFTLILSFPLPAYCARRLKPHSI